MLEWLCILFGCFRCQKFEVLASMGFFFFPHTPGGDAVFAECKFFGVVG